MEIRKVLVALSGGTATGGAAECACRLARRFGAHLEALHVRPELREVLPLLGSDIAVPVAAELIRVAVAEDDAEMARAKAVFDAAVRVYSLPSPATSYGLWRHMPCGASASWRVETGHAPDVVPLCARVADLVVLGQSGRVIGEKHTDTLEETVLGGGHPVLLAPPLPRAPLGEIIAVAWNGSVESSRSITATMPFLAGAREVHVLVAGGAHGPIADADLTDYLAWHGIAAAVHHVSHDSGSGIGELVLAAARHRRADLLVMGGYGRAPWREMIFGGATRQLVGVCRLPLLIMH